MCEVISMSTIQNDIQGIKSDKSHIKVGDTVRNIFRPDVYGIVVKILYGDNDPALIYIPSVARARALSKSNIYKDTLQRWEKVYE